MKLVLIRHGESARNRGYKVRDEENFLTVDGVGQSVKAGEKLSEYKIDAIYCSPAKRCEQTMDEILRIRNDEMGIHLTNLIGPKLKKENYERLKKRVALFVDDLKHDHKKKDTVAVISHRIILAMILYLLGEEVRKIENGELLEIIL